MEVLKSLIIILCGLVVAIVTGILVMIYGWGLEPQSYAWIIGVAVLGQFIAQVMIEIGKKGDGKSE